MYNLSELIKTDCCIDCGTNEKLREVVGKMKVPPSVSQQRFGIEHEDRFIDVSEGEYTTFINYGYKGQPPLTNRIPLTSINIDL